eukprot:5675878-Pleurochrysis_carterae.AAC.2
MSEHGWSDCKSCVAGSSEKLKDATRGRQAIRTQAVRQLGPVDTLPATLVARCVHTGNRKAKGKVCVCVRSARTEHLPRAAVADDDGLRLACAGEKERGGRIGDAFGSASQRSALARRETGRCSNPPWSGME